MLSPSPSTFNISQHQGLFKWVSSSHQVAKEWSFSFSISLSNEYLGLISIRMDWLDLLAVQGTLKSLLEHHSSKASILWHSVFFMVQLSHPYMTTGKTTALISWTFIGKKQYCNIIFSLSVLWYYFSSNMYSLSYKWLSYILNDVLTEIISKEWIWVISNRLILRESMKKSTQLHFYLRKKSLKSFVSDHKQFSAYLQRTFEIFFKKQVEKLNIKK